MRRRADKIGIAEKLAHNSHVGKGECRVMMMSPTQTTSRGPRRAGPARHTPKGPRIPRAGRRGTGSLSETRTTGLEPCCERAARMLYGRAHGGVMSVPQFTFEISDADMYEIRARPSVIAGSDGRPVALDSRLALPRLQQCSCRRDRVIARTPLREQCELVHPVAALRLKSRGRPARRAR